MKIAGIVFFSIVISIYLVPLTDADTGDIWVECTPSLYREVKEGKTCCRTDSDTDAWETPTTNCKDPSATFDSPPTDWKNSGFSISAAYSTVNYNSAKTPSGLTKCEYRVESNGAETLAWTDTLCSGQSADKSIPVTVGGGNNCRHDGTDKCKIEIRANDGLDTGLKPPQSHLVDIDFSKPVAGTYTINGISPAILYTTGPLNHAWSGFSDAVSGLKSFEIWRANYGPTCKEGDFSGCNWGAGPYHSDVTSPASGSWSETVTSDFVYGWHSSDKAGNYITESDKNGDGVKDGDPIVAKYDVAAPTVTYNTAEGLKFSSAPTLDIDFADNYDLRLMEYRFDNVGSWLTIDGNPAGASYNMNWAVDSSTWNGLIEGTHYIYFRLRDEATPSPNEYTTPNNADAFTLIKDTTPPTRSNGAPSGYVTTSTPTMSLNTDEGATCKYSTTPGQTYGSMPNTFSTTGGTSHSQSLTLSEGSYTYYVKCIDSAGNPNTNDFSISFTVDYTPPSFTIQYYSDAGLTSSMGNNPRLKAGTYYIKIMASESLSGTPTISINAEGTANDVTSGTTTSVSGNDYKYTRTISSDSAAVGKVLEDISMAGYDPAGNPAVNNPSNEGTKAAYTDTVAPVRSNGQPSGYVTGSSQTLSLKTDDPTKPITCKFSTSSGTSYDSMTNTFTASDCSPVSTSCTYHSYSLIGLTPQTYNYYVRCKDNLDNKNNNDYIISFDICARSNPTVSIIPVSQQGEGDDTLAYTVQVSNNDVNCGAENFALTRTCPAGWTCTFDSSSLSILSGSSASTTLSITSAAAATTGTYTIPVTAKNQLDVSYSDTKNANYEIICVYRVVGTTAPDFNPGSKIEITQALQQTWTVNLQDAGSSTSCPLENGKLVFKIPSLNLFTTDTCHVQTGIYKDSSNPPGSGKLSAPYEFSVSPGGTYALKIFAKRQSDNSCTASFQVDPKNPGTMEFDPSFTVNAIGGATQPPVVSFFDFSGDTAAFNVKWEAFYPDEPFKNMEVRCGLNCDPRVSNCDQAAEVGPGKGCLPYPVQHGTEDVKKGNCAVASPAYNFVNDKIMCLFYDPDNTAVNTFTNHDFAAVDFDIRTTDRITTKVGERFDLKIDIVNTGALSDSYRIDISSPGTMEITPATVTTLTIDPNQIVSAFSSVMPLVEEPTTVIVAVTSLTSEKIVTKTIDVTIGLFALPEFGLIGFLQIVAIAAVIYFLLANKMFKTPKPKRKRRR